MLYEVAVLVALGVIAYFIPRKMYRSVLLQIKYYYIGFVYNMDDKRNAKYNRAELPLLSHKVAIVTGGSRGIGAEVVKKLLRCDMEVIIACRKVAAGEKLVQEIKRSGTAVGRAKVYELNNASLESVRQFTKRIEKDYSEIHVLINNAAVMFLPDYRETEDGFEEQWAVNYLSHFLLSSLLLPLLEAGGRPGDRSRIINVTSCAQDISTIDFDFIRNSSKHMFNTHASYGQSKLAQTMFTIMLQKHLKARLMKVQTYSVHPGIVSTDLFQNTFVGRYKLLMTGWKTPEEGAMPIVYAAVDKEVEDKGGICISNCKELRTPPHAQVEEAQKELFELSLNQLQLCDFFQHM